MPKTSHSGNYPLLLQKLSAKVKAQGIAPKDISVVFTRGKGPVKCYAFNGITKEELGIGSRYTIAELVKSEITVETDPVSGFRWLSPAED